MTDNCYLLKTSYCVILGMTGHGKSTFINAITNSKSCKTSNKGSSKTKYINCINFRKYNHIFKILDTPGLGDSEDNEKTINTIQEIVYLYPFIKKLIIVKPYYEIRLSSHLQNAIKVMMDSFPLKNFWDHVIIVNNRCVPGDCAYQDFLDENPESFLDKLKQCYNLRQYMKQKHIDFPKEIKEFHVDSKRKDKFPEIQKEFDNILKNIKETKMMFKKIETKPLKREEKDGKEEGIIIKIEYIPIECTDFNNKIMTIKKNYKETMIVKEVKPILLSTQRIEKYVGETSLKWFDIFSFGISYAARKKTIYDIYKREIYLNPRTGLKTINEYYIRREYR